MNKAESRANNQLNPQVNSENKLPGRRRIQLVISNQAYTTLAEIADDRGLSVSGYLKYLLNRELDFEMKLARKQRSK